MHFDGIGINANDWKTRSEKGRDAATSIAEKAEIRLLEIRLLRILLLLSK